MTPSVVPDPTPLAIVGMAAFFTAAVRPVSPIIHSVQGVRRCRTVSLPPEPLIQARGQADPFDLFF
jgi:hypothetical protein